jgi:plastocyanin
VAGSGGGASTSVAAASTPARVAATVTLRDVAFSPRSTTVKVGQTVTWVNHERIPHNVVATSGARFRSANLLQNQAFRFRATRAGTIRYVCTIHQGMAGTIVVE